MQGTIIKGIAGFYYVSVDETIYECKARGLFKKDSNIPYVGDEVIIQRLEDGKAVIVEILARRNVFIRPPVANIDQLIVVMSFTNPAPNLGILDKFLVMSEKNNVDVVICFNKMDLVSHEEQKVITEIYKGIYPMLCMSGINGDGLNLLKPYLVGKKSALAGPSGVGKSTILNSLQEGLMLETGLISHKTNRGKHTTRHVELFPLDIGGFLFDTPGFTSFDVLDAEEDELAFFYPEIEPIIGQCKYNGCKHVSEPGCAVKAALEAGEIHQSRYKSYVAQIMEIRERERNKY